MPTWPDFDDRLPRSAIDAHHRECQGCRALYEGVRVAADREQAVGVWRREFWACRQRAFWQRRGQTVTRR